MAASDEVVNRIKANIFGGAHGAIADWTQFPWHTDRAGMPDSFKPFSSQALALDVFGTLQAHPRASELIATVVKTAFPWITGTSSQWSLRLEHEVTTLGEPRPTQLDAVLEGAGEVVAVESKFCEEGGGPCSQPEPISKGPNAGKSQCNGRYATQINPVSGATERCALTAKGVEYWKWIAKLFELDPHVDHPGACFFRDGKYQFMRNIVAAESMAHAVRPPKIGLTLLAYMDGSSFPVAQEVADPGSAWNLLLAKLKADKRHLVAAISYQAVLAALLETHPGDNTLQALRMWVMEKKLPAGIAAAAPRPRRQ